MSIAVYGVDEEWDKYAGRGPSSTPTSTWPDRSPRRSPSLTGFTLSLLNLGLEARPADRRVQQGPQAQNTRPDRRRDERDRTDGEWLNDKGRPMARPTSAIRRSPTSGPRRRRCDAGSPRSRAGQEEAQTEGARRQAAGRNRSRRRVRAARRPSPFTTSRAGREAHPPSPLQHDRLRTHGFHSSRRSWTSCPSALTRVGSPDSSRSSRIAARRPQADRARRGQQGVNLSTALDDMILSKANDRHELLGLLADVGPKNGRDGLESTLHSIFQRPIEPRHGAARVQGSWGELYAARDTVKRSVPGTSSSRSASAPPSRSRVADVVADTPNGRLFSRSRRTRRPAEASSRTRSCSTSCTTPEADPGT